MIKKHLESVSVCREDDVFLCGPIERGWKTQVIDEKTNRAAHNNDESKDRSSARSRESGVVLRGTCTRLAAAKCEICRCSSLSICGLCPSPARGGWCENACLMRVTCERSAGRKRRTWVCALSWGFCGFATSCEVVARLIRMGRGRAAAMLCMCVAHVRGGGCSFELFCPADSCNATYQIPFRKEHTHREAPTNDDTWN